MNELCKSKKKCLNVGIIGLGTVGTGVVAACAVLLWRRRNLRHDFARHQWCHDSVDSRDLCAFDRHPTASAERQLGTSFDTRLGGLWHGMRLRASFIQQRAPLVVTRMA